MSYLNSIPYVQSCYANLVHLEKCLEVIETVMEDRVVNFTVGWGKGIQKGIQRKNGLIIWGKDMTEALTRMPDPDGHMPTEHQYMNHKRLRKIIQGE